jgi:hypothetical protein
MFLLDDSGTAALYTLPFPVGLAQPLSCELVSLDVRQLGCKELGLGNHAIERRLHERLIETGEPFVLVCEGNEASPADAALFCGAREVAASGLRVEFLFRTNGARLTADSDAIRMYLRELVASFSAGVSSSPASKKLP